MIRLCLCISIHHTSSASNSVLDQTEIKNTISFSIRFSSRIDGAQKDTINTITASLCLLYCFSYTASLALMSCWVIWVILVLVYKYDRSLTDWLLSTLIFGTGVGWRGRADTGYNPVITGSWSPCSGGSNGKTMSDMWVSNLFSLYITMKRFHIINQFHLFWKKIIVNILCH